MTERHLHIVCLDVPYPADYGGASEMFHKIRALHEAGVKIHLHCFAYGRERQPVLGKYCSEVHYYERMEGHKGISMKLPYIVASRANPRLLETLSRDAHPILFEGIHTTYYLNSGDLEGRRCAVRMHNDEREYYRQSARCSRQLVRKLYSHIESMLLGSYEKGLAGRATLIAINRREAEGLSRRLPGAVVRHIPPFIEWEFPQCAEGVGSFCLYHGNLAVAENERAAIWLLKEVFGDMPIPFVVAGKRPSRLLTRLAHRKNHTCIVADPSVNEMNDLVRKAQIHVLPSLSRTGVKFKLLNAVFSGRHVVANGNMAEGTGLEPACHLTEEAGGFKSVVMQLYRMPFGEEETRIRERLLVEGFDRRRAVGELLTCLW